LYATGYALPLDSPFPPKVKMYNGRPAVFLNGAPEYPMIYALTDVPGGRWTWEELPRYNLQNFCSRGVRLVQVDLAFDHVWKADGSIDTDTAQKQFTRRARCLPQCRHFHPLSCEPT
jgi:hypothetical protein